ncbi:hypothetical protein CRP01_26100 [Flavilitoribacter nigricans DSM 23189 = NBRC 102662]|uniref:DUF6915 domain-containing protein n=2 Tax=Flavilitoribacter TaxID=2762562 RepID=A0A2D0N507_FLAN2|nr:hypothetical protein CRP01_26100 [Flavilitoribacter nigricans DSM 23189 = NBRC 102662]
MNIWVHSQLSAKKFGGPPEVYYPIHKFLDASKLFYFHIKHRILLHHTYGIELCIRRFGDYLEVETGRQVLVRDIAAEHIREDLGGKIPTLFDWFGNNKTLDGLTIHQPDVENPEMQDFIDHPFLISGLAISRIITCSDFGVYLAKELLGASAAQQLRAHIPPEQNISTLLRTFRFREKWQFSPDISQLKQLESDG